MDLFGIGSIISGILNFIGQIGTDAANVAMTESTNRSNEKNVAATNASNERNVAATNEANKSIQDSVNATNIANTQATNETNRQIAAEANAMQKELAETAYQRSTATNQISELIRAGYSEQQAKMLVAGSLSPASYQPFQPVTAEMQTPVAEASQMQAAVAQPFQAAAPRLQGAQLGSELFSSSYAAADGGVLGAMLANNPTSEISMHLDDMSPVDYSTPADFQRFANSENAPEWAKKLVSSQSWKSMHSSLLGQRAYRSWLRSNGEFDDWKSSFEGKTIQNRISSINERIAVINEEAAGVSLDSDKLALEMGNISLSYLPIEKDLNIESLRNANALSSVQYTVSSLDADQRQYLHQITKGANLAALKKQLAHDELDYRVYESDEYRDAYVKRLIQDETTAAVIGLYKQYESQNMLDVLENDPNLSNIYIIGRILDESGITDSDLYNGLLTLDYSFGRSSVGYGLLFGALAAKGVLDQVVDVFTKSRPTPFSPRSPRGSNDGRPRGSNDGRPRGSNDGRPRGSNDGRPRGSNDGRPRGSNDGRPRRYQ